MFLSQFDSTFSIKSFHVWMWHTSNMLFVQRSINTTLDTIINIMYAPTSKSEHNVWKKWWYTFTSRVSLQVNLYITNENQVFVADVIIMNLTQEMVATNVIHQITGVVAKLNTIIKIHKYRRIHEKHHFMEVHGTLGRDIYHFIRECACIFSRETIKRSFILIILHSIF